MNEKQIKLLKELNGSIFTFWAFLKVGIVSALIGGLNFWGFMVLDEAYRLGYFAFIILIYCVAMIPLSFIFYLVRMLLLKKEATKEDLIAYLFIFSLISTGLIMILTMILFNI